MSSAIWYEVAEYLEDSMMEQIPMVNKDPNEEAKNLALGLLGLYVVTMQISFIC